MIPVDAYKGARVMGDLAQLVAATYADGTARVFVSYWRGGEMGDDEEITREFPDVRSATRFMATICTNKLRAWAR